MQAAIHGDPDEVWWYEQPAAGRRPYVVLTRSEVCGVLNQVLAAPATRTIRHIPTELVVDDADGTPQRSAFTLDNVTLIRPGLYSELITVLGATTMDQLCGALARATAC